MKINLKINKEIDNELSNQVVHDCLRAVFTDDKCALKNETHYLKTIEEVHANCIIITDDNFHRISVENINCYRLKTGSLENACKAD